MHLGKELLWLGEVIHRDNIEARIEGLVIIREGWLDVQVTLRPLGQTLIVLKLSSIHAETSDTSERELRGQV